MGGFAAEFRGFRVAQGCGAAIQRTADTAGRAGRKNFLKGAENRKIGVPEVPEGDPRAPYIGCAGRFLSLETQPLVALLEVCFVQAPQLWAPVRDPRDSLLLYIGPVCKLHHSLYEGISACPVRNSLTFTYGLRLPACRILVKTISSQSR